MVTITFLLTQELEIREREMSYITNTIRDQYSLPDAIQALINEYTRPVSVEQMKGWVEKEKETK